MEELYLYCSLIVQGYVILWVSLIGCDSPLDVESGSLRPDQISAKSYYVSSPPQYFGEFSSGWCAEKDNDQYLEVRSNSVQNKPISVKVNSLSNQRASRNTSTVIDELLCYF